MKVYMFNCESNGRIDAYTNDEKGANLPLTDCDRWKFISENDFQENEENKERPEHPTIKEILTGINSTGFYIFNPATYFQIKE